MIPMGLFESLSLMIFSWFSTFYFYFYFLLRPHPCSYCPLRLLRHGASSVESGLDLPAIAEFHIFVSARSASESCVPCWWIEVKPSSRAMLHACTALVTARHDHALSKKTCSWLAIHLPVDTHHHTLHFTPFQHSDSCTASWSLTDSRTSRWLGRSGYRVVPFG